ncbi:MAG: hypothetical protein KGJ80_13250 [Chloroflexota bacterium]|nr:hypothetical protein [Chloroflexota bacterium]
MNPKHIILPVLAAVVLIACDLSAPLDLAQAQPTPAPRVLVVTATVPPATQTPFVITATLPPATATPTNTFTPIPTLAPTATSTPSGPKYPAPVLGVPPDNYNYWCNWGPLNLYWSGAELGPNEWFLVEMTKQDHPNEWGAVAALQKGYNLALNPIKVGGGCASPFFGGVGIYIWRVWIVSSPDDNPSHIKEFLSPASEIRAIRYG